MKPKMKSILIIITLIVAAESSSNEKEVCSSDNGSLYLLGDVDILAKFKDENDISFYFQEKEENKGVFHGRPL